MSLATTCLAGDAQPPKGTDPEQPFENLSRAANAARDARRHDEAIRLYEQALRLRPNWEEGWWYLGTLNYEIERHEAARNALRELVAVAPKYGSAWTLLGLCEFQLRDYRQAFIDIERGRMLGLGNNAELSRVADFHSGMIYTKFAQYGPALEVLTRLAKSLPPSPGFLLALGNATLRSPWFPEEVPEDRRMIVMEAGRAAHLISRGQKDEAAELMRGLVQRHPETPDVHYAYGMMLLDSDHDKALEQFKREIAISPNHVAARLQLAFEYLNRNQHEAGLPYAIEAVARAPKYFPARFALGQIYLGVGSVDAAIRELERAAELEPTLQEIHFTLARAYLRAGRKEDVERERAILQELAKAPRQALRPTLPDLDGRRERSLDNPK